MRELSEDELYVSVSDMFSATISLTTTYWLLNECIKGQAFLNTLINNEC